MKKLTAVFLIFSILWGNTSAAYAQQLPRRFAKGFKNAQKTLKNAQRAAQSAHNAPKAANVTLSAQVEQAARQALLGKTPKFEELRLRSLQGRTPFLPQAMLEHPVAAERAQLLRRHFAAAAPEASPQELAQAAGFWRTDLQNRLSGAGALAGDAFYDTLADSAALGIFGAEEDLSLLERFYNTVKDTPHDAQAAAVWTRALLVHGQYTRLEDFFARHHGAYPELQNGVSAYAREHNLPLSVPAAAPAPSAGQTAPQADLQEFGTACRLAQDPSQTATQIWVGLARRHTQAAVKAARPLALNLPESSLQTPENLALSAQEIPTAAAGEKAPIPAAAGIQQDAAAVEAPLASTQILPQNTPQLNAPSGKLQGGITLPAVWKSAKKALTKFKDLFKRKNTVKPAPQADGARGAFQRAGIYMASYVMGLEVATPVIANFGSSFGLSLEENILVAVATYLPYSLGAFFSNWTKKVLGRKRSMNLGLALMGGGLLAGVTLCGLNGSFIPQADAMMHFYKALACITVASLGGVLVHNSVGPMMTELSQNTNELVRQKRSAYTEFSRAVGMASSFAFPFIATKLIGMDWSLAFALPLPLIGAAALGVNLAKIPNTKPVTDAAPKAASAARKGILNAIKNNEYIRLFKEEKGVGSFLGGLFIMNAVEMAINSGFLFLLPSMTKDQSSQYLFGLAQFAAPFLLGRYLAGKFLQWFPKHNMSVATLMAAGGGLAALGALDNVYALTSALFLAETGISTGFTLGFARTAKNPQTQDRVVSLIVASALSCAFGPLLLTQLAQTMIDGGILSAQTATALSMIGIPAGLALLSAMLFKRVENSGTATESVFKKMYSFIKKSLFHPKQRRKRS